MVAIPARGHHADGVKTNPANTITSDATTRNRTPGMSRPTSSPMPKGTAIIHTMDAPYTLWLTIIVKGYHGLPQFHNLYTEWLHLFGQETSAGAGASTSKHLRNLSFSSWGCGALGQSRLAFWRLRRNTSRRSRGVPTPSGVPVGPRSVRWRGCRVENGTLRNDAIAHICCARRSVCWSRSPPCHCGRAGHPPVYFTRVHPMRRALMCVGRGNRFATISRRSVDTCTPASFAAAFHPRTSWSAGSGSLGASGDARRLLPASSGRLRPDEPTAIRSPAFGHPSDSVALRFMKDDWTRVARPARFIDG
jgi:hypothetical protein